MANHYRALYELLLRSRQQPDRVQMGASSETANELRRLGIGLPAGISTQHQPGPGDIIVCVPLSRPLMLPDNAVGKCCGCDTDIQCRPHAAMSGADLCCAPCALRRAHNNG